MKTVMTLVKEFSEIMQQPPNTSLYEKLISEEYNEWADENYSKISPHNELKELADLIYVCYGYANAKGWDLDMAVNKVHANNIGRCIQPDGSIIRREDGKIIKNKDYPKVDLKDCL